MADWFDPTTWERAAAKALATPLSAVSKVRDRLSRKGATRGARGTSGNRGDKAVYVLGAGFTKAFLLMRHCALTSSTATVSNRCSPSSATLST
jgi:hypothetical protein